MKPPICPVCHRTTSDRVWFRRGGYVEFADYAPLPNGMVGHPRGYEWFCGKHRRAAEKLASGSLTNALAILTGQRPPANSS